MEIPRFCPQLGANWPFFLIQLCSCHALSVWMRLASHLGLGKQCNMEIMSELENFDSWHSYLTHSHGSLLAVPGYIYCIIRRCFHMVFPYFRHYTDEFWANGQFAYLLFSLPFPYVVCLSNHHTWHMGCMNLFLKLLFFLSSLHIDFSDVQASTGNSCYLGSFAALEHDVNHHKRYPKYTTSFDSKIRAKHRPEPEICEVTIYDHLSNRPLSTAYNAKKTI